MDEKYKKESLDLALRWFQDNDVPAYEDDGSIYVQAGRDADVQISTSEIDYRADLQTDYEREKQSLNN
tara:strand:- start:12941 stop:13144 length:204 start_codon:yes stop_codon:yes gene_type:complete